MPVPTVVQQGAFFSYQNTESLIVIQYNRTTYIQRTYVLCVLRPMFDTNNIRYEIYRFGFDI